MNVFVSPVIKALELFDRTKGAGRKELDEEDEMIFEYGFDFLFENIEQIKLYLQAFEGDYEKLEKNSLYIRLIFELEELKVEIEKMDEKPDDSSKDLSHIDQLLDYFEGLMESNERDETVFERMMILFYALFEKYDDVVLIADAFSEYCATYGI